MRFPAYFPLALLHRGSHPHLASPIKGEGHESSTFKALPLDGGGLGGGGCPSRRVSIQWGNAIAACCLTVIISLAGLAVAAPTDDIADALVSAGSKPQITADSLPGDFARLTKFTRHEANGMVIFADGGPTDGYVRHAQAQYDTSAVPRGGPNAPLFSVAFELASQPDFTFEGLSAALEQRLGTPTTSSNQIGATFRTWLMKTPDGRSFTIAQAQGSDNGDPVIIVHLIQKR